MRERGLKLAVMIGLGGLGYVAPYAGAWIEIGGCRSGSPGIAVAPYAGAWIEIPPRSL